MDMWEASLSLYYGSHMLLPKIVMPIYSKTNQVQSWDSGSLSKSLNDPCASTHFKIINGDGENGTFYTSFTSLSDASAYSHCFVGCQTCLISFNKSLKLDITVPKKLQAHVSAKKKAKVGGSIVGFLPGG